MLLMAFVSPDPGHAGEQVQPRPLLRPETGAARHPLRVPVLDLRPGTRNQIYNEMLEL